MSKQHPPARSHVHSLFKGEKFEVKTKSPKNWLGIVGEWLSALVFSVVVVSIVTWPAVANIKTHLISDGGDLFLFAMHHTQQQLSLGKYPFETTTLQRYPYGYNIGVGIDAVAGVLIGAQILSFTRNPVLSYNLTLLIILVGNFLVSYSYFKYLAKSKIWGLVGAVSFGLSFYVLARGAGHLNLMFVAGWPLIILATLKLSRSKPNWKFVVLLYLGILALSWGSLQYLLMLAVIMILGGLTNLIFYPGLAKQFIINQLTFLSIHLIASCLFLVIFWWSFHPTIVAFNQGSFVRTDRDISSDIYNTSLQHYFLPTSYTSSLVNQYFELDVANLEYGVYLGLLEIFVFILYLFSTRPTREKLFILTLIILFFVLSLGVSELGFTLPYKILVNYFPFSGIAEPGRFVVIINLLITCGIVLIFRNTKHSKLKSFVGFVVLLALIGERATTSYFQVDAGSLAKLQVLNELPGKAVFNIPVKFDNQDYSFIPVMSDKSITDGYIHWSTDNKQSKQLFNNQPGEIKRYECDASDTIFQQLINPQMVSRDIDLNQQMLDTLVSNDIRSIVIHKDKDYYHPQCQNVRARLSLLLDIPQKISAATDSGTILTTIHDGFLQAKYYFPQSGKFTIKGISASGNHEEIQLKINDQVVPLDTQQLVVFQDTTIYDFGKIVDQYQFDVKSADKLYLTTNSYSNLSTITMWYDYIPQADSNRIDQAMQLKLIWDNSQLSIYEII